MPPSTLDLNFHEIVKRDGNATTSNPSADDQPLAIGSPGPVVGFTVCGLVAVFLLARLFWWLRRKLMRNPTRRQARGQMSRSFKDRMLHYLHDCLPAFICSHLPQPTPTPPAALSSAPIDPNYPARSIDTLPPYPGFNAPISPADSRRFLYLVPIMPMVDMFSRRPAPGSDAAITSISPTLVDHTVPDGTVVSLEEYPPDYTTLTLPHAPESGVQVPAEAHLSRSGQDEWRTRVRNHE